MDRELRTEYRRDIALALAEHSQEAAGVALEDVVGDAYEQGRADERSAAATLVRAMAEGTARGTTEPQVTDFSGSGGRVVDLSEDEPVELVDFSEPPEDEEGPPDPLRGIELVTRDRAARGKKADADPGS